MDDLTDAAADKLEEQLQAEFPDLEVEAENPKKDSYADKLIFTVKDPRDGQTLKCRLGFDSLEPTNRFSLARDWVQEWLDEKNG